MYSLFFTLTKGLDFSKKKVDFVLSKFSLLKLDRL